MARDRIGRRTRPIWYTSPAASSILNCLAFKGDMLLEDIASSAYVGWYTAYRMVVAMEKDGFVHVVGWRHKAGQAGAPSMVVRLGRGDRPAKPSQSNKIRWHSEWRARKRAQYGSYNAYREMRKAEKYGNGQSQAGHEGAKAATQEERHHNSSQD